MVFIGDSDIVMGDSWPTWPRNNTSPCYIHLHTIYPGCVHDGQVRPPQAYHEHYYFFPMDLDLSYCLTSMTGTHINISSGHNKIDKRYWSYWTSFAFRACINQIISSIFMQSFLTITRTSFYRLKIILHAQWKRNEQNLVREFHAKDQLIFCVHSQTRTARLTYGHMIFKSCGLRLISQRSIFLASGRCKMFQNQVSDATFQNLRSDAIFCAHSSEVYREWHSVLTYL